MITIKKSKGTASCRSCFAATYTSEHPAQNVPVEIYKIEITLNDLHNCIVVHLCARCLKDLENNISKFAEWEVSDKKPAAVNGDLETVLDRSGTAEDPDGRASVLAAIRESKANTRQPRVKSASGKEKRRQGNITRKMKWRFLETKSKPL